MANISNDEILIIENGFAMAANDADYHYSWPRAVMEAIKTVKQIKVRCAEELNHG
jgi:hypothetical protein